ncbi:hypothetical protein GIR22_03795 [Pseudomonas sp. CCM 7891]|uniref:Lipoprotein n=1 Tax=Pseudomonas karstica TaxID=1055468 RepID=A0A7X2UW29_9PSED|nr:hypothetical protein [Pseudomonas karstica]MTD18266.1 hypothetical protein [Pseudomonas karstica]
MKWSVLVLALALGGCASVSDIKQTPPTLSVISGKKPQEYAACVVQKLASTRSASQIEPHKEGVRVIVPQKFSADPSAIFEIEDRSSGSSIKLYESMSNVPIRPGDVKKAGEDCISG